MGSNTVKKIKEQLGMSPGKARSRLWTQLLFSMAQELGRDICFRCGEKIETLETFSVDHKQAWLDVSPDLFWKLENLAFSHRLCNGKAARRNPEAQRESIKRYWATINTAPEGTSWCMGCKDFLVLAEFHLNRSRIAGVQKYCIECRGKGIGRKNGEAMRKYRRPPREELMVMLDGDGYRELGQKLGVSNMTVLQWAKDENLTHIRASKRARVVQLVEQ